MKSIRRKIIAFAMAIVIVMGVFPPWSVTGGPGSNYPGIVFSLGYHPLFFAPMFGEISVVRLFVQWTVIAVIASAAIYFEQPLHLFCLTAWSAIQKRVSELRERKS